MADDNQIDVPINFETSDAIKALKAFEDTLTKVLTQLQGTASAGVSAPLKSISDDVEKASGKFSTFAIAVTGINQALELGEKALHLFLTPIEKAIEEASQAETGISKLNFAIASTGEFTNEAAQSFLDFASNIQKTTQFSDDAAVASLTLAKNFGLTNDKAKDLVSTAADLAAQTGESLPSATSRLLDSLNGQSKALKDLGPQYKNLTEEQAKAGKGVELIKQQFAGAALILTGTFNGALAQAQNNFADVFKEFGKGIVQNTAVINAINLVSHAFSFLADELDHNKAAVSDFVTATIRVTATFAKYSVDAIAFVVEGYLSLGEALGRTSGVIQAAFQAITGHVDEAKKTFTEAVTTGNDFTKSVVGIREGLTKFVTVVDATADSIHKAGDASNSTTASLKKISDGAQKSGEAFGKTREEALKFAADIEKANENEFQQASVLYANQIKQTEKFVKEKGLTRAEGNFLLAQEEEAFNKKVSDLQDKFDKDELEKTKKLLDDRKALVEKTVASPVQIIVDELKIKPAELNDFQATAAAGAISILGSVVNGAAGAKSLISAGAGAFADAFLPGIGSTVAGIISKLSEGPDAVKQFVREFVDATPEIVQNIAEAAPAFVEALVDTLVNKGGAVRIGVAIAIAFSGYPIVKSLGKQIGTDFVSVARAGLIAAASSIAAPFVAAFALLPPTIRQSISDGATELFGNIQNAFAGAIPALIGGIQNAFSFGSIQAFQNLLPFGAIFRDLTIDGLANGGSRVYDNIIQASSNFASRISGAIGDSVNYFNTIARNSIGDSANYLRDQISRPFDRIIDFFNKLNIKVDIPGVDGGGGNGNIHILGADAGFHFAKGGVIPPGFSGDNFPLPQAKSGERIIPDTINTKLENFLNGSSRSQSNDSLDVTTVLLNKILNLLAQPMNVTSTANVNGKAFADIILSLSRSNARLTA